MVKMSLSLGENAAEGMKVAYENGWFNWVVKMGGSLEKTKEYALNYTKTTQSLNTPLQFVSYSLLQVKALIILQNKCFEFSYIQYNLCRCY